MVQIWFFPRSDIPDDLSSDNPNPDNWSDPQGVWPATGCNPEEFFSNQHLILYVIAHSVCDLLCPRD